MAREKNGRPPQYSWADVVKRAVILAHYDPDGIVDPYVVHAARGYRAVADRLILVSSSALTLPATLDGVVDDFLPRDNVGYDFCSWRDGLALLGTPQDYDEVVCVNDSVYGPLFDLRSAFSADGIRGADFWGMVMSAQRAAHVQSWFFAMRRPILESPVFREFWDSVAPQDSKDAVIDRYEVGLTAKFRDAGFAIGAVFDGRECGRPTLSQQMRNVSPFNPYRSGRHRRRVRRTGPPYNPSELFWEPLWEAGVPYLKAGIFKINPYRMEPRRVLDATAQRWPEWGGLVANHLDRICVRWSDHRCGPDLQAALLQQIFEIDPLACPTCHGAMRLVEFITQPSVIDHILTHRRTCAAREAPTGSAPPR